MIPGYTYETDYRNADRQLGPAITLPGAINALQDAAGTLDDAWRTSEVRIARTPDAVVAVAQRVKVYRDRANDIQAAVNRYSNRNADAPVPSLLNAIAATVDATQEVYKIAREVATRALTEQVGL